MIYVGINFKRLYEELRQSSAVGTRSTWSFVCEGQGQITQDLGYFMLAEEKPKRALRLQKLHFLPWEKQKNELGCLNE